ncbi:alkaline phytoceramidase family protein [Gorgonomyces haynaldii]|nr:alkaline phytoceramidase family protein [Gorgonomyces haynaldii]
MTGFKSPPSRLMRHVHATILKIDSHDKYHQDCLLSMVQLQRSLASIVNEPFWGQVTSSVDWCEINYEVTPYVAEFFNTISSLAMAIVGLWGSVLHPWAETRFHVAFLSTVAVGLGSVAFHGTLQKFSQALDEVPMLYSALAFAYIGINQRYKLSRPTRMLLGSILTLHAALTTYLVTAFEGHYQFLLFHLSFGTAQTYALYQMVQIYRRRKRRNAKDNAVWIFERGLLCYFAAFGCWLTDMLLCEYVNPGYPEAMLPLNPQFHAWWHILISMGLYNLALLTLYERVETLHGQGTARMEFTFYIIPYVRVSKPKKSYDTFDK